MEQSLNPQQRMAVSTERGPLLILAGAGTGKTRVVTERIGLLLRRGVAPKNILGVTFTNKAAAEMRSRLAALPGGRFDLRELILSTFHSLCVRILRRDAHLLGYSPGFSICDQGEQLSMLRKTSRTVRGAAALSPDELLSRVGRVKNRGLSPEDVSRSALEEDELVFAAVYRRYQESLKRQNSLDFDDLLLQTLALLKTRPESRLFWQERFQHVLVDEFQDANQVQFDLVRLLAAPQDNLCVVGDDDQSIYAWRGAMAGNILRFRDVYPGCGSVALEQNYRSTSAILSAANALIRNNSGRREKNLWSALGQGNDVRLLGFGDQTEEAAGIASEIRRRLSGEGGERASPEDFAVIIRANAQSRPFEEEFVAARVPYEVIGGQSLFDRKEARDVLSFLGVASGHGSDGALLRIINTPPRGIGGKTVDLLSGEARRRGTGMERLLAEAGSVEGVTRSAAEACEKFAGLIRGWRRLVREGRLDGLVRAILDDAGYGEELKQLYDNPLEAAARWNDALDVGSSLASFAAENGNGPPPERVVRDFLQEAALSGIGNGRERERKGRSVKIITAHSAKGLEFPFVYVAGMEEDIFPHKNALESGTVDEERRLLYVAMTRARRELTLTHCRGRVSRGKKSPRRASRFLAEIPPDLIRRDDGAGREDMKAWLAELRKRRGRG